MRRIGLAVALAVGLTLAPLVAEAQAGTKLWRIGYLSVSQVEFDKSWVGAFRDGLRELGYVEGQNLVIEQRHAAGHSERLYELAAELLRLKIDILVVYGAWLQPKKLPSTIPIVFTVAPDPVREGLVASLARPGGNVTGLSDFHADLVPKRLELLKEVVPSASLVGVLFNPGSSEALLQLTAAQAAARALGMTVLPMEVKGAEPPDIEHAFATIERERRTGALLVIAEPAMLSHCTRIAEFAIKNRLPREPCSTPQAQQYVCHARRRFRCAICGISTRPSAADAGKKPAPSGDREDLIGPNACAGPGAVAVIRDFQAAALGTISAHDA
jgi:putative ABC transport system substrate-binding protein